MYPTARECASVQEQYTGGCTSLGWRSAAQGAQAEGRATTYSRLLTTSNPEASASSRSSRSKRSCE
jgi:hypothetical protein